MIDYRTFFVESDECFIKVARELENCHTLK